METIEKYLHNLYRVRPDFVYSVSRDFAKSCQTSMLVLPDDVVAHPLVTSIDVASLCPNAEITVFPWKDPAGTEGAHHQPGAHLPEAVSDGVAKSEPAMENPRVRIYTDYKSPYAFVANKRLFELEEKYGVELEWLPYTLRIAEFMGKVEERTPHFWRKVRYAYMDARRYANAQGLTMKGPRRIYDAFYASAGMLFAQASRAVPALP